jgi:hypothetical protein
MNASWRNDGCLSFQVRRKWNNMKKLARKKWESDDPALHKREPENLENAAQFEIIRQEEVPFF